MFSREKRGWKRGYSFRQSKDDTPFFTAPLTDIKIRQAQAGNKPTKLTDGNGLYLLAKPSGSKFRRYRYRIAGKENLCAIGEYPTISLQDARAARDDARELEGGIAESKSTKHQAGIDTPKTKTIRDRVFRRYLAGRSADDVDAFRRRIRLRETRAQGRSLPSPLGRCTANTVSV
ncbi:Arm DNA-binding domain-containing protein [Burkholderia diffusa]|uniref:Arm DNA-binding domain-containing protein n=1 Tax=Burkholderia diffusa TaxID=488732 RepID=UPI0009BDA2EC